MWPFKKKKQDFLGVDIGAGGVKVVQLRNEKGRARLFSYGFTEREVDVQTQPLVDSPEEAAETIKQIASKARLTTTQTVTGLPISSVFSAVINVPKGNEKEVKEAVQWQAKKLIPIPIEEMVLNFKPINQEPPKTPAKGKKEDKDKKADGEAEPQKAEDSKKDDKKTMQVLLTGASNATVKKYITVFKSAGLELISLETEALALIRSLVGKDRATTMIVDIGAVRTNIIVVEKGIPFVTRSIDMGGISLTRSMAKAMETDLVEAEKIKMNSGAAANGDGLPKVFESTVAPMLTELQYSMSLYTNQTVDGAPPKVIEKIVLTGGTASVASLAPYFAKQLGMRVYVGDPWARVVYPEGLRPVLDSIGARFAVGIGLGMRDIE